MFYAVAAESPHTPLYISPAFERFGYPLKDWLTQHDIWDRVMHPEDREEILAKTREAMRNGDGIDFEYRVICKDGRTAWVRDRSCFVKDSNGIPLCWQGVILDVTERKQAQHELECANDVIAQSEARYRQLFENANDIIYVHDLEGNYISINQAGERIFGYSREEALSLNMRSVIAPEHVELVKHQLTKKIDGDTDQTVYEVD